GGIGAGALSLEDTDGTIAFGGGVDASSITTNANGFDVTFAMAPNVTGAGSFNNADGVTFNDGGSFAGGLTVARTATLAGTLSTTNNALDLATLDLIGGASLSSAGGAITTDAVNSNTNALNLNAGAGAITVASFANGGDLTIGSSGGATFAGSVNAGTVTLADTDGLIAFEGDTTISTGMATAANGYDVAFTGTTNTVAGNTTFLNTGTVTLGDEAGDTITFADGLTATAPSDLSLAGTVATSGAGLTLGDATVTTATTLGTGSGGGDLITGALSRDTNALTLNAGAGDISVVSIVGNGTLTLDAANDATFTGAVTASTANLNDLAGMVTFQGSTTINTALNTSANAFDLAFTGTTNTVAGNTMFQNTGSLTLGDDAGDGITFAGGVNTTTGPSAVNVAGTVATTNSNMVLGPISVGAASMLTTGIGGGNLTAGAINRGTNAMSLNAGSGNITVASIEGNGSLTVINANNATFEGPVTASTVNLNDAAGTIAFQGDTTINTGLNTNANGFDVAFTGSTNTVAGNTMLQNTGTVTLGDDAGDRITFEDGLNTASTGGTNLAGTVATGNADLTLGGGTATATTALDTGAGGGAITTGEIARGTNALSLNAGTGNIALASVGGNGALTVASANDATFAGPVTASMLNLDAISGAVAFAGDTTINTGLVTSANGFDLAFTGTSNSVAGSTTFQNTGNLTLGDGAGDSITFSGGVNTTAGPSSVSVSGTVATNNSAMVLGPISVAATSSLTTGGGGGNLTAGAVSRGGNALTLNAGTGDIEVGSIVGNAALTVANANDATFMGPITASTVNLNNAGGTIAFRGDTTINTGLTTATNEFNVAFTGGSNMVAGATEFLNTGTVTLGDASSDSITFTGGVDTTAASSTNVSGSVVARNADLLLGDVALDAAATLRSGSGEILTAAVSGAGQTLSLQDDSAGSTGAAVLAGDVTLGNLVTFGQGYDVSLLGGVNITSATTFLNLGSLTLGDGPNDVLTFAGGLTTIGSSTNPSSLSLAGTVATNDAAMRLGTATLTEATTLSTGTTGAGGLLQTGTLNAAGNNLMLRAGTSGAVTIGAVSDASTATFASGDDVRIRGGLQANTASFGSANTFTVEGPLMLNNLQTQSNASRLVFTGGGSVANGVELANTGGLVLGDGGDDAFLFAGGLDASSGALSLDSILRTDSAPLTTADVSVAGSSVIDTTNVSDPLLAGGDVTLGGPVQGVAGNEIFEIRAGTGDVIAADGVGNIGSFFVRSANELTLGDVTTSGNTIRTVTSSDVNLNGDLFAASGDVSIISLNGSVLQANGTRVTAAQGNAHLVAFDQIDLFEVHAPQGDIFLVLLSPDAGGQLNRVGPPGRATPDFVAGDLLTVVSAGRANFGSAASGFRIQSPQSFISLDDGQSFVDETNALTLNTLPLGKQQQLSGVFDQVDAARQPEIPLEQLLVDRVLNVITGVARAQQAISDRAQTQSQAATQQADEEEVLTDLTEDVFIEIALYDFDRERPLCLPTELQGFDAAPCVGQAEEDVLAFWFDHLARDLLTGASNDTDGLPLVQQLRMSGGSAGGK
ncbi:MAG: hypothetical protein EA417_22765, partial [Gammaproteobacteria bacterium]